MTGSPVRHKVLIVDDEYFNFEMLKAAFNARYQLSYAQSGQDCLNQVLVDDADLVLLDVCMPGLDGYDTCRLLKNNPQTQHVPVIMLSGLDSQKEQNLGFDSGCDAYLVKPFIVADVIEQIDRLLSAKVKEKQ